MNAWECVPTTQRIRVIGGPWADRIGCEGVLCRPPADGTYPAKHGKDEVIVLLDDDPLGTLSRKWTCVIGKRDVEGVGDET